MIAMRRCCLLVVLAAVLLSAAGCSSTSVRHLPRTPWVLNQPQTVTLNYWEFRYVIEPRTDVFTVSGRAVPTARVPVEASHIQELWLAAYLAGPRGGVLARDIKIFPSQPLDRSGGVEFSFVLRPEQIEKGDLSLAFGYRMTASRGPEPTPDEQLFFASETALTRF
jgi:hypothetical protein